MSIFEALIFALAINILMFLPAYFFKTDKLTDISYALTFILLAFFGLLSGQPTVPTMILFLMIALWATRLGGYLLFRIQKIGKDRRFDGIRENFGKFSKFWIFQGATVWLILLPSIMFFQNNPQSLPTIAYLGILIWLGGFLIESISDYQKYLFTKDQKNKGKWIRKGLWKNSRHPNYFGEIMLWIGIYVFTVFGLDFFQSFVGLASPAYIIFILLKVSGVPLFENKYKGDESFEKYKKQTNLLLPWPPKKNT